MRSIFSRDHGARCPDYDILKGPLWHNSDTKGEYVCSFLYVRNINGQNHKSDLYINGSHVFHHWAAYGSSNGWDLQELVNMDEKNISNDEFLRVIKLILIAKGLMVAYDQRSSRR